MNELRQAIHEGIDRRCASLPTDPWRVQRVLNAANEKEGVKMKRKMPLALILLAVLLLTSCVAVAAGLLWQNRVVEMKQTEHELGDYCEWPALQRIALASDIVRMGHIAPSAQTAALLDDTLSESNRARIADDLMLALTGLADVKEVHSSLITYAILGHEDTWTPEQRVWWHGIVTMHGDDGATDTLISPEKGDLTEQEAIRIAGEALQTAYGFTEAGVAALHPVANMYVTDARPDYKRWDIQFKRYRAGSSTYVEKVYSVIVDENGQVIGDEDVGMPNVLERANRPTATPRPD